MKIYHELTSKLGLTEPVALTIGNFDGIHYGHQAVLSRAISLARQHNILSAVVTFENHTSEVLRGDKSVLRICTLPHKIHLLENAGIDLLFLLRFTKELSQLSAEMFLREMHTVLPFSHLVLGHDASFGKNKQGNQVIVQKIGQQFNFQVEYLEPCSLGGSAVSSSRIRTLIQHGDFNQVQALLGRKYSIYTNVTKGSEIRTQFGVPALNLEIAGLCLPPYGLYSVDLIHESIVYRAVAKLGGAPTSRGDQKPLLEVQLLDSEADLFGEFVEVVFH